MKRYIQYQKKTGVINAWTDSAEPLKLAKDLPVAVLEVETSVNPIGMRVNLTTKTLEICPVITRRNRINKLRADLQEIDIRRGRALEDFVLDGSKASMQKLRDDAAPLRAELSKLLKEE